MKNSFNPYDLTSAFQCAISAARTFGECRYVIQTAVGYQVRKELSLPMYQVWKVNADGGFADEEEVNQEILTRNK